jgi:hypothetical protein
MKMAFATRVFLQQTRHIYVGLKSPVRKNTVIRNPDTRVFTVLLNSSKFAKIESYKKNAS